jgi:hypothetical protein
VPIKSKKKDNLFIDTLVEWAATASLHLQTQHFSGKDNEDIGLERGLGHAEILEKLSIPAEGFATDTNAETRVAGIFTDGSYEMTNLTRGSLIVSMDILRRQGVSSAPVVYLGTPEHWTTALVRILRIIPAVKAGEMDAL